MGAIIDFLVPLGLGVGLVYLLALILANSRTKALREEVKALHTASKAITDGSTSREGDLRRDLTAAEEDVAQLNEVLDRIMGAIAGRPNPLDLSGPYQPIVNIIEAQRPRHHPHH